MRGDALPDLRSHKTVGCSLDSLALATVHVTRGICQFLDSGP